MNRGFFSAIFPRVALCCVVIFAFAGCAVQRVATPMESVQAENVLQSVRVVIQHGDWLVIRGVHGPDNAVATLTNAPLSHAAIYDAGRDEVVEATGEGVHTTPLPEFIAMSRRVLVMRPMWANAESSARAVEKARSWIGKGYNYTGLVGLNSPDRYYCTQVALKAYEPFDTQPENPIPPIIEPGQMYHWGRILYDSGP